MSDFVPDWDTCTVVDSNGVVCRGVQVVGQTQCLYHLSPGERMEVFYDWYLSRDVDLRGTTVTGQLLDDVLYALQEPSSGDSLFGRALFDHARFRGYVKFRGVHFSGDVSFSEAQFSGDADFMGTRFDKNAWFDRTQFNGSAAFGTAQFTENAWFEQTHFSGGASFSEAQFHKTGHFSNTQFNLCALFSNARFEHDALFSGAQFSGPVWFNNTHFHKNAMFGAARFTTITESDEAPFLTVADFSEAQFHSEAAFDGAQFNVSVHVNPAAAAESLVLDRVVFTQPVQIHAAAGRVTCRGTQFMAGADLKLQCADIVLDNATCAAEVTIAALPQLPTLPVSDDDPFHPLVPRIIASTGRASPTPRLLSLRGVDASHLVLTELDLSRCRFAEARQLNQIRIDGYTVFAGTPHPWRWRRGWTIGRAWPGIWRWSARQVLAEEHTWRATTRKNQGWTPNTDNKQPGTPPLGPARLAVLYRGLRQARETRGDQPGAADFYYGEMEMRRHSPVTPLSERIILAAYWALSGYGLRATRALTALATVIAVNALLLQHFGFVGQHYPGYFRTLLYSASATVSLDVKVAGFPDTLTAWGQVIRIVLRIAGPLCLGLAALALRGRVKR